MRLVVGLLAVGVMASSCGSGVGSTPEGFARFQGEGFSVAHPPGWTACEIPARLSPTEADLIQISAPGGDFPPVIEVSNEGRRRRFDHALRFHRLLLEITPGYRALGESPVEVAGAEQAVRIDFRNRPVLPGVPPVEFRGSNVLALGRDGDVVSLLVSASAADYEAMTESIEGIIRSLRVGNEEGGARRTVPRCKVPGAS
jgi:hypothetical protein